MSLILGLDSGGTKTVLAFADRSGQVLSLRLGPGLDPSADCNWPGLLQALLARDDQLPIRDIDAAVLGLPFHGEVEQYSDEQASVARELIPGNTLVQNDVRIAFDGALAERAGVLILAGTGSMAWASLNGRGDPHIRVGGWGDAFGDEGSAYWIGREALGAVSRHLDGRVSMPEFSAEMLSALGLKPDELIGWCYALENRRMGLAKLAVTVSALAEAGNADAVAILDAAADCLAEHITAAWRQTKAETPLRWSYAGGVLASALVRKSIAEKIGCDPVPPRLPPVGGALLRAANNAGWSIDDAWIATLSSSLTRLLDNDRYQ
jgi:N-acetylglucosamine kinase